MKTCLVTGGAGFIGCALSTALADRFDRVVVLDNLHAQVHPVRARPDRLDPRVELVVGDVTEPADWDRALERGAPDVVLHLAAETGTAQSLAESSRHALVNVVGTTRMLDALSTLEVLPGAIVLTSSRAVYGEGAWRDLASGAVAYPGQRSHGMLADGLWDFPGMAPLPHRSRQVRPTPSSVYGATKLCQENLLTAWCGSHGVAPVIFRLQNVYGPGQSLTNPYTGIVPFFAQLARDGRSIPVYEDGAIVRDFVYVDDVVSALVAGAERAVPTVDPYDIGSGSGTTIAALAAMVADRYGAPAPHVTGQFRDGDVRSGVADTEAARAALGWRPTIPVETGISRLCDWIDSREQ